MTSPPVSAARTRARSDPSALSFDAPLIEVFGLLLEAQSRLVAHLDRELIERQGMSLQHFEVLIRLARTPGESLTAGELARAVALSSGGATRLVDRLEAAGLVARRAHARDRRIVRIVLTTAGRTALRSALPIHLEGLERHLAAPLAPDDLVALESSIRSVRDAFDDVDAP